MRTRYLFIIVAVSIMALLGPASSQCRAQAKTISALEAMDMLASAPKKTFLVDVRTRAEYTLHGHAPGAYNVPWRFLTTDFQVKGGDVAGGKAGFSGYQPSAEPNPDFVKVVKSLFKAADHVIVISADGSQGAKAAEALAKAGFKFVYNIEHGFWGAPLTPKENEKLAEKYSPYFGLRGRVNGWVFWGLPITRRIDPRLIYLPDSKRMRTGK